MRNFNANSHAQVVALCDMDNSRLDLQILSHPMVQGTRDANEVINSPDIDVVVIATPSSSHFDLTKQALNAGKHCFVTKPLGTTPEEALELVELADTVGRVLHVDHTFVYTPPVRKLKEILEDP